jgi:zinc-binding in reverse transcriptase
VKLFGILMLFGRLLTHDVMVKRNITCSMDCVMCNACPVETSLHLLITCLYAAQVWNEVGTHYDRVINLPGGVICRVQSKSLDGWQIEDLSFDNGRPFSLRDRGVYGRNGSLEFFEMDQTHLHRYWQTE